MSESHKGKLENVELQASGVSAWNKTLIIWEYLKKRGEDIFVVKHGQRCRLFIYDRNHVSFTYQDPKNRAPKTVPISIDRAAELDIDSLARITEFEEEFARGRGGNLGGGYAVGSQYWREMHAEADASARRRRRRLIEHGAIRNELMRLGVLRANQGDTIVFGFGEQDDKFQLFRQRHDPAQIIRSIFDRVRTVSGFSVIDTFDEADKADYLAIPFDQHGAVEALSLEIAERLRIQSPLQDFLDSHKGESMELELRINDRSSFRRMVRRLPHASKKDAIDSALIRLQ